MELNLTDLVSLIITTSEHPIASTVVMLFVIAIVFLVRNVKK